MEGHTRVTIKALGQLLLLLVEVHHVTLAIKFMLLVVGWRHHLHHDLLELLDREDVRHDVGIPQKSQQGLCVEFLVLHGNLLPRQHDAAQLQIVLQVDREDVAHFDLKQTDGFDDGFTYACTRHKNILRMRLLTSS